MTDVGPTVREVLRKGAGYLETRGVGAASLSCELLLARLLRCRRLELPLHYEEKLGGKRLEAMRRGVRRVGSGEPVQYVLGETEFMGHRLAVDRRALIPRPETEQLVEAVLGCEALWRGVGPVAVLDVGTGSGCIAVSLALARPEAQLVATDLSRDALSLAAENARALHVADRIVFTSEDPADCLEPEMFHAVVSNPPYVRTADYERLPRSIREFEPRAALDGGPAGLAVIEQVVQDAAVLLKPGGRLFLEIGEDQARAAGSLLGQAGFQDVAVKQDLAGRDRVAAGRLA